MLEKALRLCDAAFGMLWTYDDNRFHIAAHRGLSADLEDALRRSAGGWLVGLSEATQEVRPGEGSGLRHILDGDAIWRLEDTAAEPLQSGIGLRAALVELGGVRTQLLVALRKDNALLGVFHIYRREVRSFSDQQIALLQNFCCAGGHRHGKRAAFNRDARGLGPADRNRRSIAGYQLVTR